MSLPSDIALSAKRLRDLAGEMRGHLNELRAFVGGSERGGQVLTNAKALLACVQAECTSLETTLAAARMVGELPREGRRQETGGRDARDTHRLEACATTRGAAEGRQQATSNGQVREAMIESLHRAGDHSLDEDLFAGQADAGECPVPAPTKEGDDGP